MTAASSDQTGTLVAPQASMTDDAAVATKKAFLASKMEALKALVMRREAANPADNSRVTARNRLLALLPKSRKTKILELAIAMMDRGWTDEEICARLGLPSRVRGPLEGPDEEAATVQVPPSIAKAQSLLQRFETRHPPKAAASTPAFDDVWKHATGHYIRAGCLFLFATLWEGILLPVLQLPGRPWFISGRQVVMFQSMRKKLDHYDEVRAYAGNIELMREWMLSTTAGWIGGKLSTIESEGAAWARQTRTSDPREPTSASYLKARQKATVIDAFTLLSASWLAWLTARYAAIEVKQKLIHQELVRDTIELREALVGIKAEDLADVEIGVVEDLKRLALDSSLPIRSWATATTRRPSTSTSRCQRQTSTTSTCRSWRSSARMRLH